jgi:V/A-type H+-transporting ATPase subunit I
MLPERMSKVTLICRSNDTAAVIDTLAELKAIHLVDHQRQTVGSITIEAGKQAASAEALSATLIATRNLLSKIGQERAEDARQDHVQQEQVQRASRAEQRTNQATQQLASRMARTQEIADRYSAHEERIRRLQQELQSLKQQEDILSILAIDDPIETIFQAKSVESILAVEGKHSDTAAVARLEPLMVKAATGEAKAALVVVHKRDAQRAREALAAAGFILIDLAPVSGMKGTPKQARSDLAGRKAALMRAQEQEIASKRDFGTHYAFLRESEDVLALELLKAQAPLRFGATKRATLIRGFVPERNMAALNARLGALCLIDAAPAEDAPILLKNPPVASSFEQLIGMYSLPKYNEIDPTSLMAITFPLFFGFMLGDIGYGLVALLAFVALRHYVPKARSFADILILSAIASIAFGFLYAEAFGMNAFGMTPVIHRTENVLLLMGIAVCLGALHLNLGLLLGIYNERHEGLFFAVVKKGSWILLEAGVLLLAASFGLLASVPVLSRISSDPYTAGTLIMLAIIGIAYSERIKGILELPMIFSNMLSYVRLAAIGLSSVYLAFVINQLAAGMFAKGGVWLIAGILILLFGHALNLALGLLGPFLHSLRLHYVEFFTKFYEGGGQRYAPFGAMEAADG